MLVVMLAALIFIPFAAVMSQFLARIEGTAGVLTYTFLLRRRQYGADLLSRDLVAHRRLPP